MNDLDLPHAYSDNIHFVLVRPVYLGNIGAMARLAKNFALPHLSLVDPPKQYKDAEARKMAVGAFDILKQARVFTDLKEALSEVQLSFATTCSKQRAQETVSLAEAAPLALQAAKDGNKVAFVLGDERNGLTNAELNLCHRLVRIPTARDFPSMNLAQAAAVIAYELTRAQALPDAGEDKIYPTGAEEEELLQQLGVLFDKIEFSRTYNRDVVLAEFRTLYKRLTPTKRELSLLRGVVHKLTTNYADE